MVELRWNPVLREWIVVTHGRQRRPVLPEAHCPFCPGSPEVPPGDWEVMVLPNRFPSLMPDPPPPEVEGDEFYRTRPARGVCEVVLYTPEHDSSLGRLGVSHIRRLVDLWAERYRDLGGRDYVKYVFIFENKGREIGVTLDHPHGQIYTFPFIPPVIRRELRSAKRFSEREGGCLFCRVVERERRDESRVVWESGGFVCFLPFFARWPFGVHLYPKRHVQSLLDLDGGERTGLAEALKATVTGFDSLFGFSFPYIMAFHQAPTDGRSYQHYHFHVEFYPPYRERDKIKFFAGVEQGTGTVTYDYRPEEKAEELRRAFASGARA